MHDVAVVGGGPAGLLTARRCAEAGLDVTVLEEHEHIGEPVHCTGIISLETATLTKISEDVVLNRLRRACLIAPGGGSCHVPWTGSGTEELLAVDRAQFDRSLAEQAQRAGATVRTGARVDEIASDADGVTLLSGARAIHARACVLACGVSYRLHRQLGLGLPAHVLHTAQVEVESEPADAVEIHFGREIAPDGFLWAVPVRRGEGAALKLGVLSRGDAGAGLARFLARPEMRARLRGEPGRPVRRLLPL